MASAVRFEHKVVFQGLGTLIVEEGVSFGSWMAGSKAKPIMLQPREPGAVIRIGARTVVVNGCEFIARAGIEIGADCLIGAGTNILDSDFHGLAPDKRNTAGLSAAVTIGENVWFGNEAMVLKGVTIGRDAVIGARCVVTKDVPAGAIAVGNPMRLVGEVYA